MGGDNTGSIQNVEGESVSHVTQSVSAPARSGGSVQEVRAALEAFRAEVERCATGLPEAPVLRAMAVRIGDSLEDPERREGLRGIVRALPLLVAGTVVEQAGQAVAHALGAWLG